MQSRGPSFPSSGQSSFRLEKALTLDGPGDRVAPQVGQEPQLTASRQHARGFGNSGHFCTAQPKLASSNPSRASPGRGGCGGVSGPQRLRSHPCSPGAPIVLQRAVAVAVAGQRPGSHSHGRCRRPAWPRAPRSIPSRAPPPLGLTANSERPDCIINGNEAASAPCAGSALEAYFCATLTREY